MEVPDFAKAPLSMSGVWLEIASSMLVVRSEGLASLVPFVPTSSRTFDRSSSSGAAREGFLRFIRGYLKNNNSITISNSEF